MRRTLLTAAAVGLLCSQAFAAMSVKLGYSNIAGELRYVHYNQNFAPFLGAVTVEDISAGVVTFGGAVMSDVNKMFSVGFSVGASMAGEWEFDETKMTTPPVGTVFHPDSGDKTLYRISKVPVEIRAAASLPVGPGTASLGLGVGALIIGWNAEGTDVRYWDGTTPGSINSDEAVGRTQVYSKDMTYMSGATPVFVFEIAPAFDYKLNATSSVGIELPMQFASETVFSGTHTDFSAQPPAGTPNPSYTSPEFVVTGLEWGVNVVYKIKI